MVKRGRSGGVSNRRLVSIVNECFNKGLQAEGIVNELSKDREFARSSRHAILLNVNKLLRSRNDDEEETNKRTKLPRTVTASPSASSLSEGNVSDNAGKLDFTNDNLRASYANSRKGIRVSNIELLEKQEKEEEAGMKFKDLGGLKEIVDDLTVCVKLPLLFPQILERLGEKPISGILLHGPPGCGKTTLARAIANETGVPFYMISASEVDSGVSGESEENIRNLFSKAYRNAPSIIFIDEIDAIASKRDDHQQKGMETRVVTQLMNCMDEEYMLSKEKEWRGSLGDGGSGSETSKGHVLVIAATNRPEALDPALRRSLRFDKEIFLGVPDEKARAEIFSLITRNHRLDPSFDSGKIVRRTSGFVVADFKLLAKEAANVASKRLMMSRALELSTDCDSLLQMKQDPGPFPEEVTEKLFFTTSDFEEALEKFKASLTKEGFSTTPSVTWEDIGGLDHLRDEFHRHVIKPLKYPEECVGFEFCSGTGFLLYGPPGCGKTLVAKAVANEAGANFIHVEGPELLSKYVGDTEKAIRELFSRARMCSPCIVFFDEVDALTTKRGSGQGAWVVERPLTQLLIELNGGQQRDGVIVIGATNKPEVMDPAVTRSGRFGRHLYVPLPNSVKRGLILKSLTKKISTLDPSVDLDAVARMDRCEDLNGSDLEALVVAAGVEARDDKTNSNPTIKMVHFEQALTHFKPSLTKQQLREYDQIFSEFRGFR